MNASDYKEEYYRRLRRTKIYAPPALKRKIVAAIMAEDYPDPTRSQTAWDEDTQSYVRVRTEVDSHAIDRGEG